MIVKMPFTRGVGQDTFLRVHKKPRTVKRVHNNPELQCVG